MNQFTKLNDKMEPLADQSAKDHVAVRDIDTGLIWTANNVGDGRLQHKAAIKACVALTLGEQTDWRLPTIKELLTLVNYERVDPAIDIDAFPTCKPNWYWSSSPAVGDSDSAWGVLFYDGYSNAGYRNGDGFVRAVRGPVSASQ
jgi:Protein of unknown function (DUF1566)